MTTSKKKTAAEVLAELEKDPRFIAQRRQREALRQRESEDLARAEQPLRHALAAVGIDVASVWELVNQPHRHCPEALPVLLEHLRRKYPDAIRAGIARALTTSETRPFWHTLTGLYRAEQEPQTKEGVAVAISGIATDEVIDDVIALARARQDGSSRVLLLSALERSNAAQAQQTLVDLESDPRCRSRSGSS